MNSEDIKKLIDRRHPDYEAKVEHWKFCEATYAGGRSWFDENLFRYMKEGVVEFKDRVKRAYRFNHTRETVDLVNKYLFRARVVRNEQAPECVKNFWDISTLKLLSISEFAQEASKRSSIAGRPWIIVDSTLGEVSENTSQADVADHRVYAYIVSPIDVLDMSFDDEGRLNWILLQESYRNDEDPIEGDVKESVRWRLWTRDSWHLFQKDTDNKSYLEKDSGEHGLGLVPAIPADHVFTTEQWSSPAMIEDIAYLDRAAANYLSNLDAIIQDQTFSQLIMPAQSLDPSGDEYKALVETGTKRIFTYDSQATGKPEYISPDPKQAQMIMEVVRQIIAEIYHSVGLAGEHTKDDNSQGIDNSSGVAKSKDFERVVALLRSKAESMERIENEIVKLVCLWEGVAIPEERLVKYTDQFDVRGLRDELSIATQLSVIEAPASIRSKHMEELVKKLFPGLSADLIKELRSEITEWAERQETVVQESSELSLVAEEAKRNRADAGSKQSQTKAQETGSSQLKSRETGED